MRVAPAKRPPRPTLDGHGIAYENPADRHWRNTGAIPEGCSAGDLNQPIGSAVPEANAAALPGGFRILENGGELAQSLALDRGTAAAFALCRREGEQVGIEAQSGDDTDMFAHCGEEFDGRKCTVGNHDDIAVGQPAAYLQGGLPRPIDQCLGSPQFARVEALGGCEQSEEW